jgi:hypothetical protein
VLERLRQRKPEAAAAEPKPNPSNPANPEPVS